MGMTKKEIKSRLDEIIDFAGVEKYIDTPVKRYSSGMYVRLAFGVAAHLEPDIMIVDEVLAVGDAEFQKKALGKMKEVSGKYGRTVLFVSHNLAAVKTLCDNAMVLENGKVKFAGPTVQGVSFYLKGDSESNNKKTFGKAYENQYFALHEISLNPQGKSSDAFLDEYHEIEINTLLTLKQNAERLHLTYVLNNENGDPLFTFSHINSGIRMKIGTNHLKCIIPKSFLNQGSYYLSLYIIEDSLISIFIEKDILAFDIQVGERTIGGWMGKEPGFIKPIFQWEINSVV
jgi:lipopolysaccharide transport system ATP-binding protein